MTEKPTTRMTAKPSGLKAAIVPVTPFEQNCTLIWDEVSRAGAIVDPGGDIDRILAAVEQTCMIPEKILLTHGHIDHAGGAAELRERLKVKIEGPHKADKPLLDNLEVQARTYGFSARNVTPDHWLEEGDAVLVGDREFEVLHCPGHSPGSIVFKYAPQMLLLVGDVIFRSSIGRTDLPGGDHDALINAIKTKLMVLDDAYGFVCGHGPGSTIGLERRTNPYIA